MDAEFAGLLEAVRGIVEGNGERNEKLEAVCRLLHEGVPHYDWVGFYVADLGQRMLTVGPYVGEPTEHVRIPFGRGICGQVADREKPLIVQDVSEITNYLSCGADVKSEIVVPVVKDGRAVAQIDIDSHTRAAFSRMDLDFLTGVCGAVAHLF